MSAHLLSQLAQILPKFAAVTPSPKGNFLADHEQVHMQATVTALARAELLQALCLLLFLLFPTHDPALGLATLGASKPLHKAIKRLRAHPAVLAYAEVPVATMALLQHSPYLLSMGESVHAPR